MGITVLPSPAAGISEAGASLISGLDKYLNPNKDLQLAVQRAISTNPDMLQKMADLEKDAPGTMASMGLGHLADMIGKIPQSAASLGEKATRARAGEQATAKQGAEISADVTKQTIGQYTNDQYKSAMDLIAKDPTLKMDSALKLVTGQTQVERAVEQAKAPVAVAEASRALEQVKRARHLPDDLNDIDWTTEARDFLDGNLGGAAATAYFGNPDTRDAFHTAIQGEITARQTAAHKVIAGMRAPGMSHADKIDTFRDQKAFQRYSDSNGVADLETWKEYLYTPGSRERAEKLLAGMKPENEKDKQLLKIAEANKRDVDSSRLTAVTKVNQEFRTSLKGIENAETDEDRDQMIGNLNSILRKRAALGGLDVEAKWDKPHWWSSGELTYIDKAGKPVPPGKVAAILSDDNAHDIFKTMSPRAEEAMKMILNAKGQDPEAMLANLKAADKSPGKAVSAEVEEAMIQQELIKPRTTAAPVTSPTRPLPPALKPEAPRGLR